MSCTGSEDTDEDEEMEGGVLNALDASSTWLALLMFVRKYREALELPVDVCKIVREFGVQGWVARHPSMSADGETAEVKSTFNSAYPVLWSRGVRVSDTPCFGFEIVLRQNKATATMDDRYMLGFINEKDFVFDDYPVQRMGGNITFELDGHLSFDETTSVELCRLELYHKVTLRLVVNTEHRHVTVRINDEKARKVKFPDRFSLPPTSLLHPYVVLRSPADIAHAPPAAKAY